MLLDILSAVVLAFWIALALDRKRWWPSDLRLGRRSLSRGRGTVAVVIPARDEAGSIPRTLPALLEQAEWFDVLVLVDDRSTDGTGRVAREVGARSPGGEKLRVVEAEPPPEGWSGKLHALQAGLRAAEVGGAPRPEWILFTDADILHPPGSVEALLGRAEEGSYDIVSVMVRLRCDGLWERLLVPPFVYFFQLLYPFRRVGDPRSKVAAAAGGCVLVRSETLARMGGIEAIRGAIIDDVTLAGCIKRTRGRCWLGTDPEMLSLRGYGTLREIANMVARTAFTQLGYRWSLVVATLLSMGLFFVAPPVLAGAGFGSGQPLAAGAALGAWAIQSATLLPVVRHHGVRGAWCVTLPLSAALYGWMTALSAWRHTVRGGVEWKGRPLR